MLTQISKPLEKVSDEHRIELIRKLRNELVRYFLDEQNLQHYFTEKFKSKLNALRKDFIRMELQDLLVSSVDLVHYASLLIEMKHTGAASLAIGNEKLFYEELDLIFKKYVH